MVLHIESSLAGLHWEVADEYRDRLVGPGGLRLDEWLRAGQARIVKHGPHRTVYHVALPDLEFYVKHNRLSDTRSWLRQLVRPAKARMEYDRARAVAQRGVPTFTPLGVGESHAPLKPGESFLLTLTLRHTETLSQFIEATLPGLAPGRQAGIRQRLAVELGKLLARMHDTGVLHNDLHAGNLLIRLGGADAVELFLIDLHAVRLGKPLDERRRRDNLIMLNRWFVMRAERSDRLRFWRAYGAARREGNPVKREENERGLELEEETWASNLLFWSNRDGRCLANNRYYERVRSGEVMGHVVRDLDGEEVQALLAAPDEPFGRPGVKLLKDSRSSTVAELDMLVHGERRRVIYKRFRVTSWSDPWSNLVRRSPALRSWVFGQGLRERGLPTARPLAVLHRRRHGLIHEGYLLTEMIPAAVDVHGFVDTLRQRPAAERRFLLRRHIERIARLVRALHRCNLAHRDLKAVNILMSPERCPWSLVRPTPAPREWEAWLIDLVGVTRHRRLGRQRKVRHLARLHASFCRDTLLSRTDKLRFLRVYLQWGLLGRLGWKRWWRAIAAATQAKIARNQRNGRPLA